MTRDGNSSKKRFFFSITKDSNELATDMPIDDTEQIGHEHKCALQDADQAQRPLGKILGDLRPQFQNAFLDLVRGH